MVSSNPKRIDFDYIKLQKKFQKKFQNKHIDQNEEKSKVKAKARAKAKAKAKVKLEYVIYKDFYGKVYKFPRVSKRRKKLFSENRRNIFFQNFTYLIIILIFLKRRFR